MQAIKVLFFAVLCGVCLTANAASILSGKRTITLLDANDQALVIGHIEFTRQDQKIIYKISLVDAVFSNEFLSMRPFKCISQSGQMVCHLIYPYKKLGYITEEDLTDLEYDLLFLHKSATEYGINAWNGLYYDLKLTDGELQGTLKEVDLNVLAAPPDKGDIRPVTEDMLHEVDSEHHLFPRLIIR